MCINLAFGKNNNVLLVSLQRWRWLDVEGTDNVVVYEPTGLNLELTHQRSHESCTRNRGQYRSGSNIGAELIESFDVVYH